MDGKNAKISHSQPFKDSTALLQRLQEVNVSPLWAQMARLNPAFPNPTMEPFLWQYRQIRPCLLGAGQLISEKQAERRVLMLVNPRRRLQLVQPRETAPAHRHAAFAVRYIIEGITLLFKERELQCILATSSSHLLGTWHDHGKKGADEEGGDETDVDSSPIVFPWRGMLAKLHDAPGSWAAVPYRNDDGGEIGCVIGASAERLDKGAESPVRQETSSSVYHVIQGSGWSEVGGNAFSWQRGDTFCIPAWHEYKHVANGEGNGVYLYRFDDSPMLKPLGLLRTQINGAGTLADLA